MRITCTIVATLLCVSASAQQPPLTPRALERLLTSPPQGAAAEAAAASVRAAFGGAEALMRGAAPMVDELSVAWAIELPEPPAGQGRPPRVAGDIGGFALNLTRLGTTNVYAGVATLSHGAGFTWHYEAMVRRTPEKPIRVFLQAGANDLDNAAGNWPLANLTLAKSLAYAGYDYRLEYGHGFHSVAHGRALLPDSLRWLWRDWRESRE
jgi:hypothetical protein